MRRGPRIRLCVPQGPGADRRPSVTGYTTATPRYLRCSCARWTMTITAPQTAATLDPMLPSRYRILRMRREIPDTFTMELEPEDASAIPPFATGQFNMLYVYGVGEVAISISGNPAKPRPLVHTVRVVG